MKHTAALLLVLAGNALAHPGHGTVNPMHGHLGMWAEWLASGALAFSALFVLGTATWAIAQRLRKQS